METDLLITDPPYNVAISNSKGMTIANDDMSSEDFRSFIGRAMRTASEVMKDGAPFYVWFAIKEYRAFWDAIESAGLLVKQELIWNKNSFVLGRQDYQWKHEPCLYGWKDGAGHYFCSSRKEATVIDCDKPLADKEHPTMKPIKLFAYLMANSSRRGDVVLDLFGGSGTTIMAAEQLGRKAYVMELDPHYCDVILARWEKMTGNIAMKLN